MASASAPSADAPVDVSENASSSTALAAHVPKPGTHVSTPPSHDAVGSQLPASAAAGETGSGGWLTALG